ncbi:hypothetical protein NT05LI_3267, partial [Listeria ivanovii FSL F6-596]
ILICFTSASTLCSFTKRSTRSVTTVDVAIPAPQATKILNCPMINSS